ncbi:MAG: hypothetical protein GY854_09545 [Deltaproteobacteria bacterium]|nr:hypothetical protein [Deltaproteobacteria bacterium]
MSNTEKRVLSMIEDGKISPNEGKALLEAMKNNRGFSLMFLFDPFSGIPSAHAIVIALIAAVGSVVVSVFMNVRFDGFLDIHAAHSVSVSTAVVDVAVDWLLSAIVLWLCVLPFKGRGRVIDFIASLGVARVVLVFCAAAIAFLSPAPEVLHEMAQKSVSTPSVDTSQVMSLIPIAVVSILFVAWFITLLVFAIKHASGLSGGKAAGAIVVGILVAETVSKIVLWAISG